ncbi:SpoIIAA-like [Palleronia salina]|uniref:SpoIIAA-like n=1 Tax=Palleronia salina TaxID=313368 RepID=A0A1M6J6I6_9RHOB|nr:STAS/SEC14 domain-containing protein [Palleronia salina]SHJ42279.1 SpoIIAA-like [Palleronia salina]
MFVTPSIRQAPSTEDHVFAFHIMGEITSDEMEAMGAYMNEQFEHHDNVSMLLIFDRFEGSEAGAGLNWESLKAQLKSVTKVDRYAVVGAPSTPSRLVEVFGKVLPLKAQSFDRGDEDAAWQFVGARPA